MREPVTGPSRGQIFLAVAIALCLLVVAAPWLAERELALPVVESVGIAAEEIYRVVDRGRRLPMEVALPHIARAGLAPFLALLPLESEVRDRLRARIQSKGFVHETVPLLLALKSMYLAPDALRRHDFDASLRRAIRPDEQLPGIEHSMFRWQAEPRTPVPPNDSGDNGKGIKLALIAELLAFYDALYLAGRDPTTPLPERLACDDADAEAELAARAERSRPAQRRLLTRIREGMEPGSDLASAVDQVLDDEQRLEVIGLSVVRFVEMTVCKHYRMLASRVTREAQLKHFLLSELARPGNGRLWSYLQQAQDERRYAALVIVDGLQGHLIEALASGDDRSPFIRQILQEMRAGESQRRATSEGVRHHPQQTHFLEHFGESGFAHSAYLPFFRDLYSDGNADANAGGDAIVPWGVALAGISTTPTISVRNLPVVMTGAPVAGSGATGIPNFHFVDRSYERQGMVQGRGYYFYGNDALQLSDLAKRSGMQSLFERLASHSSYSCASQYDEWAQAGIDPFFNLALGEASRDFAEILCFRELENRSANESRLRGLRAELLALREDLARPLPVYDWYRAWGQRALRVRARQLISRIAHLEPEGFPELLVYYNPWPDHFAHFKGPFSDEIISPSGELARLDHWLGRLAALYRRAGVLERTVFGMAGDHGLSPVFRFESPQARVFRAARRERRPAANHQDLVGRGRRTQAQPSSRARLDEGLRRRDRLDGRRQPDARPLHRSSRALAGAAPGTRPAAVAPYRLAALRPRCRPRSQPGSDRGTSRGPR